MKKTWAAISKANSISLLAWDPKVNIHSGLDQILGWFYRNMGFLKSLFTSIVAD